VTTSLDTATLGIRTLRQKFVGAAVAVAVTDAELEEATDDDELEGASEKVDGTTLEDVDDGVGVSELNEVLSDGVGVIGLDELLSEGAGITAVDELSEV
jgi:hypothetical protein